MSLPTLPTGFPVQVFGCDSAEGHSETVCAEAPGYNVCYHQTHQPSGKGGKGSHTHPHTLTLSQSHYYMMISGMPTRIYNSTIV